MDRAWAFLTLTAFVLVPLLLPLEPYDAWWHLAMGREIVARGAVPAVDLFSWTRAGAPFFDDAWLAQLAMLGLHRLGGVPALLTFQAALVGGSYAMLFAELARATGRPRVVAATLLVFTLPLSFDNWQVRPQSFGLPLAAAFVVLLARHARGAAGGRVGLALLPVLTLAWVNLHGSFVLGLGLVGAALVAAGLERSAPRARDLAVVLAFAGMASLGNPRGVGVVGYVAGLLRSGAVRRHATEWARPRLDDVDGRMYFGAVVLVLALAFAARRRLRATEAIVALAGAVLGAMAVRNVMWFALFATPLVAGALAALLPRAPSRTSGDPVVIGSVGVICAGALVLCSPWVKPLVFPPPAGLLVAPATPTFAVAALARSSARPSRLLHSLAAGSYLPWALPAQRVFIDPRFELYPEEQWDDFLAMREARGHERLLDAYGVDAVLVDPLSMAALGRALGRDPRWRRRCDVVPCDDARATYFERVEP